MFRHSIFGIAAFFSVLLALVSKLLWLVSRCVGLLGWSPAHLMFNECDGRYDHDGRMLYVNAGLGGVVPLRIGCPSEITVITLRRATNQ